MAAHEDRSVDPDEIRAVLESQPIQLGVLFGSHARGTSASHSDIDVAVAFDPMLSDEKRSRARIDLVVELSRALGTDDIDVVDLDTVRPAVGASALADPIVLVGDAEEAERRRQACEHRTTERTHEERMQRFDELLARMEKQT